MSRAFVAVAYRAATLDIAPSTSCSIEASALQSRAARSASASSTGCASVADRLMISTDCGMGREGMSRRHAFYKCVSLVLGTNIVRKEIGAPEARVLAADERSSLVVPPQ